MNKPYIQYTHQELTTHNDRDKSNDHYIDPEPIELEMEIIKNLLYKFSQEPSSPENTLKIQELLEREDKLAKDLDDAYNT